jgi:hypothetical protein
VHLLAGRLGTGVRFRHLLVCVGDFTWSGVGARCASDSLTFVPQTTDSTIAMPQVKHYGCFQFKAHITPEQIGECFASMSGMVGRIPGLLDFNHGPYDSGEGLNDGFTHGFIMTFASPQARDEYLPHPIHEEVKAIVVPCLERVVVFDFNMPL